MRPRHPLPQLWLMTDERMGESLWTALARLPRGSGVVFRHYGLAPAERRALFARVVKLARRRELLVVRAGAQRLGRAETGLHGQRGPGLRTFAAHSRREAVAAMRGGADLLFVSPVFATRSHPGARALGRVRLGLLIRGLAVPVIALGGMDATRAAGLKALGVYGWAAIDAWTRSAPAKAGAQSRGRFGQ
ncbi:thiamine-phosphate pyrophosphorylase [Sphingomonas naasensis]|uniref:Thiamine phosphate synthase n=1 Tax=Sphingomonas naasensis TaxID=1344951 RepID=A0A4S1WBL3_9SPHN|nr:thiamine phosphate synthase [Sphingomonas naasensis]NIJ21306.1 thiamine-phosphate pyrophosphorylase [Sphingomonas naasensis]TGX38740.1 thiamine phosphate synthase [Sphingomonas naasensis]